jgi:hypothetical protein
MIAVNVCVFTLLYILLTRKVTRLKKAKTKTELAKVN